MVLSVQKRLLIIAIVLSLNACSAGGSGIAPALPPPIDANIATISEVQGNGNVSPMLGQRVKITGIVTGDFQQGDADTGRNLGGFFMQMAIGDGDPATSDGIFVFDRNSAINNVVITQSVEVTGTVTENFFETQIIADSVRVVGSGAIQPTDLSFPATTIANSDGILIADFERFEGMFVGLADPATISDVFNLERYGELTLSSTDRLYQFTNSNAPDMAGYGAHKEDVASRSLILDDGLSLQNPDDIHYLKPIASNSADYSVRVGDTVAIAGGNIRFSRGSGGSGKESFRLEPAFDPLFVSQNVRNSVSPDPGGNVKVASFNVLNYFTTIDNGQNNCGPDADMGCRGADSTLEFSRQHQKTVSTLLALDADVVGLMELENNGGVALQSIVDAMNVVVGNGDWASIETGVIGGDAITVGLIYRTSVVQPAGTFAVLTSMSDSRFNDRRNRPALAQTFDAVSDGGRFTVAVNHLKSKGSSCDDSGDPNLNDGQGNCNQTRTDAAAALAEWLTDDPTGSGDPDVLIMGDLNAYLREDPLTTLENAGFENLLETRLGTDAYSYVFYGQAGALDHALVSSSLSGRVTGVGEWHINADEPPLFDYNLEAGRSADLFDPNSPFRASDHDPVIVGINP